MHSHPLHQGYCSVSTRPWGLIELPGEHTTSPIMSDRMIASPAPQMGISPNPDLVKLHQSAYLHVLWIPVILYGPNAPEGWLTVFKITNGIHV